MIVHTVMVSISSNLLVIKSLSSRTEISNTDTHRVSGRKRWCNCGGFYGRNIESSRVVDEGNRGGGG